MFFLALFGNLRGAMGGRMSIFEDIILEWADLLVVIGSKYFACRVFYTLASMLKNFSYRSNPLL